MIDMTRIEQDLRAYGGRSGKAGSEGTSWCDTQGTGQLAWLQWARGKTPPYLIP